MSQPPERVDVIMACRRRDMKTLRIAKPYLFKNLPCSRLVLYVPDAEVDTFRNFMGEDVLVIGENSVLPDMTLSQLQACDIQAFPKGAGWYYQQFLKYAHAYQNQEEDFYLIWDSDTIPLQSMQFFDNQGRMIFTKAEEHHDAYFQTYKRLLNEDAREEFSFISQHQLICKSILRELLSRAESIHNKTWPWAIVSSLGKTGYNQFSEYETYGNYVKNHYPESVAFRSLQWLRGGTRICGYPPKVKCMDKLGRQYAFAAFEASEVWWRRLNKWRLKKMGKL